MYCYICREDAVVARSQSNIGYMYLITIEYIISLRSLHQALPKSTTLASFPGSDAYVHLQERIQALRVGLHARKF